MGAEFIGLSGSGSPSRALLGNQFKNYDYAYEYFVSDDYTAEFAVSDVQRELLNKLTLTESQTSVLSREVVSYNSNMRSNNIINACFVPQARLDSVQHLGIAVNEFQFNTLSNYQNFKLGYAWIAIGPVYLNLNGLNIPNLTFANPNYDPNNPDLGPQQIEYELIRVSEQNERYILSIQPLGRLENDPAKWRLVNSSTATGLFTMQWRSVNTTTNWLNTEYTMDRSGNEVTIRFRIFDKETVFLTLIYDFNEFGGFVYNDPRDIPERVLEDSQYGVKLALNAYHWSHPNNEKMRLGIVTPAAQFFWCPYRATPSNRGLANYFRITTNPKPITPAPFPDMVVALKEDQYYDQFRVNATAFGIKYNFFELINDQFQFTGNVTVIDGTLRTTITGDSTSFTIGRSNFNSETEQYEKFRNATYNIEKLDDVHAALSCSNGLITGSIPVIMTSSSGGEDRDFPDTATITIGVENIPGIREIIPGRTDMQDVDEYWVPKGYRWYTWTTFSPTITNHVKFPLRVKLYNPRNYTVRTPAFGTTREYLPTFRNGVVSNTNTAGYLIIHTMSNNWPEPIDLNNTFDKQRYKMSQKLGIPRNFAKNSSVSRLQPVTLNFNFGTFNTDARGIVGVNGFNFWEFPANAFDDLNIITTVAVNPSTQQPPSSFNQTWGGEIDVDVYFGTDIDLNDYPLTPVPARTKANSQEE
jgi:hypothetical protein